MRGRGHGWRRGHSRRVARFVQPALLLLLHQGPAHGYTLIEQLEELGLEGLDSSLVYRALRNIEDQGWVSSTWSQEQTQGPPRRVYCLTALGDEVLSHWIQDLAATQGYIDYLVKAHQHHMGEEKGGTSLSGQSRTERCGDAQ